MNKSLIIFNFKNEKINKDTIYDYTKIFNNIVIVTNNLNNFEYIWPRNSENLKEIDFQIQDKNVSIIQISKENYDSKKISNKIKKEDGIIFLIDSFVEFTDNNLVLNKIENIFNNLKHVCSIVFDYVENEKLFLLPSFDIKHIKVYNNVCIIKKNILEKLLSTRLNISNTINGFICDLIKFGIIYHIPEILYEKK